MVYSQLSEAGNTYPHVTITAKRTKKLSLAPISEDRKVTFAAGYILDETLGMYQPVDMVLVRFIPHVSEYHRNETKCSLWYSPHEIRSMKQEAFRAVDRKRAELIRQQQEQQDEPSDRATENKSSGSGEDVRGLERLVYNHNDSARLRLEALRALCSEQQKQRRFRYGIWNPGGIVGDDNFWDEKIRQAVEAKGESLRSQAIAVRLAEKDAAEADEYLGRVRQHEDSDDTDGCAGESDDGDNRNDEDVVPDPSVVVQQQRQSPHPEAELLPPHRRKPEASFENCCWCVDVIEDVGRSFLLRALLRPFLTLQRGDALVLELDA